jgi:hypothetical protein
MRPVTKSSMIPIGFAVSVVVRLFVAVRPVPAVQSGAGCLTGV